MTSIASTINQNDLIVQSYEREKYLTEALHLVNNGTFAGIFIQTIPGVGTLHTVRKNMKNAVVLNCFKCDNELLGDLANVAVKAQVGSAIIFDIHEKFNIDQVLAKYLETLALREVRFVFISRNEQQFGEMSHELTTRVYRIHVKE